MYPWRTLYQPGNNAGNGVLIISNVITIGGGGICQLVWAGPGQNNLENKNPSLRPVSILRGWITIPEHLNLLQPISIHVGTIFPYFITSISLSRHNIPL